MKKNKIEVIRMETSDQPCYICKGTGIVPDKRVCKSCKGTGIFEDSHYILVANGIAFSMDTIK